MATAEYGGDQLHLTRDSRQFAKMNAEWRVGNPWTLYVITGSYFIIWVDNFREESLLPAGYNRALEMT
ncbi:hypothetical protein [Desulfosporosinus sp. I2]|uniref:hypothetical protein n=1 Tax=Desulfosporosinus sp. I2 TaxID=1617025 RepID=UPI0005F01454|nr:hypothetical protein [Desulfosporosinus sp. I2]